jgi:hypothetical protein
MQGFHRANPTSASLGASTSTANTSQPAPEEGVADYKTIIAQPSALETSGQISSRQVIAANLFPIEEPNYAGPIAVVIILMVLIYYALYKIAGSGQQTAPANPSEGGNEPKGQYQPSGRDSSSHPKPHDAQASGPVKTKSEGAKEPLDRIELFVPATKDSTGPPATYHTDN